MPQNAGLCVVPYAEVDTGSVFDLYRSQDPEIEKGRLAPALWVVWCRRVLEV